MADHIVLIIKLINNIIILVIPLNKYTHLLQHLTPYRIIIIIHIDTSVNLCLREPINGLLLNLYKKNTIIIIIDVYS